MTKRKKPGLRKIKGCPRCGGQWQKVSGFLRCKTCGHVSNLFTPPDWRDAYPDQRPREFGRVQPVTVDRMDDLPVISAPTQSGPRNALLRLKR